MQENIKISIVLPTYNRLYSIKEIFLPSLEKQTFLDYELIIVDDGSNDGTGEYFRGEEFKNNFKNVSQRSIYKKNEVNLGLPASRNIGVDNSIGKRIFMVEDDLLLIGNDFLENANKYIKEYGNEFFIISPKRKENSLGYFDGNFDGLIKIGLFSGEIYFNSMFSGLQKNIKTTQACSFIRKDVFTQIRYKPMKGVAFREESDFYFSATLNGYRIIYLGDLLQTEHLNNLSNTGGTRQDGKNLIQKEFNYIRCHYLFLKRYFAFPEIRILFFILVRGIKHFSNLTGLKFIKNILVLLKI